ncbi:MAG: hypothetical protein J7494_03915 [Sphingobium sp.]|nr:hypothetical protein [Sphingobium sp.]
MNGTIIVAIITVGGSIFAAAITSYLTKAKDREAEWRSQKLAHYKRFMTALSAIVGPTPTTEEKVTFADAANDIFLVGSPDVLVALRGYLDETAESNTNKTVDRHDELLTILIFAIREDLGRKPNKPDEPFEFRLWSGKPRT